MGMYCIVCIIKGVKLQKLEKGSILRVHDGVHIILEVAPPIKALTFMLFTVNERS